MNLGFLFPGRHFQVNQNLFHAYEFVGFEIVGECCIHTDSLAKKINI